MNKCLVCFNGISEVDVIAAFINDLSKLSEGIITGMESFCNSTKVVHWWWIWKAVSERHTTEQYKFLDMVVKIL